MERFYNAFDKYSEALSGMPVWMQRLFGGDTLWDLIINNILQAIAIAAIGWLVATHFERRHLAEISDRETDLKHIKITTTDNAGENPVEGLLLSGSVVISHDFFRMLFIRIRKLIGGNIKAYERLAMRGRREAILRLKEEAEVRGIKKIINVRLNTAKITGRFLAGVSLVAYGTGIKTST